MASINTNENHFTIFPVKDATGLKTKRHLNLLNSAKLKNKYENIKLPTEHVSRLDPSKVADLTNDYIDGSAYQTIDNNVDGHDPRNRSGTYKYHPNK
jgi:hypothetical protein